MSIHLRMSILFCIFVGEMRGTAHPPMTGAQNLSTTNMEQKYFRFEFSSADGSGDVRFLYFASIEKACRHGFERVMASPTWCGVLVSLVWGDTYLDLMKFDITGLDD